MTYPRARPVGEAAATLELGNTVDPALNARVRGIDEALRAEPFPGFRESVPTHCSLLVLYDPAKTGFEEVRHALEGRARGPASSAPPGRLHSIPVVYGGADCEDVASARGLSKEDVAALHSSVDYTAYRSP